MIVVRGALAALLLTFASSARAELDLKLGGRIQTDIRGRVVEKRIGHYWDERVLPVGFDRNENILKLNLNAGTDRFRGVVDVDIVWLGRPTNLETFGDLSVRERIEPVRFEAHSLYMEATDLFVDGLDVRIGQQIVSWGVGDQFNPTNNLNADDLEDPLLFGTQQGNVMVRADYTPIEQLVLSAVVVPIFKPALLPLSAELGIGAVDRLPHLNAALRRRIHAESASTESALFELFGPGLGERFPTTLVEAKPRLPETKLDEAQVALRLAATVAEQDLAISFYRGRFDFPFPIENSVTQRRERICNPADPNDCVDGRLEAVATLFYPKMSVLGFNAAGEVDLLGWLSSSIQPLGWRFELGVFFPEKLRIAMYQSDIVIGGVTRRGGEYDYQLGGERPLVLDSTPFAKWALGLDYSFGEHVYVNVQWVHGLPDELGAGDFFGGTEVVRQGGVTSTAEETVNCTLNRDGEMCAREVLRPRLGDYLVVGVDLKFLDQALLLRLFSIVDLSGIAEEKWSRTEMKRVRTTFSPFSTEGGSVVLYPELDYNFGNGLELGVGALAQLGEPYTKFGDPAAGGTIVWGRARYSF